MLKLNARTIYVFCMNSVTPEAVAAAGGRGVFHTKCVLKNLAKFIAKHPRRSLNFSKVGGLMPDILSKKKLRHSCFAVNFAKFLETSFL